MVNLIAVMVVGICVIIISIRSWQVIQFEPLPMSFIKIVGTRNSANEVFHCVHFECPASINLPPTINQSLI
jgi:BTB/POZ domain-containing protein 9